jgi:SAM-dependent methyltransferase
LTRTSCMSQKGSGNTVISKANIGCGFDIKSGWTNIDNVHRTSREGADFQLYDITEEQFPDNFKEQFDFALLNHTLCTMNDFSAHEALINIHRTLKPGGKLQVIDMDLLKVFKAYQEGRIHDIPITEGSIDDRLCLAISGYGTRLSLYTPLRMCKVLVEAGFRIVLPINESEYDTRPFESLIVEAVK